MTSGIFHPLRVVYCHSDTVWPVPIANLCQRSASDIKSSWSVPSSISLPDSAAVYASLDFYKSIVIKLNSFRLLRIFTFLNFFQMRENLVKTSVH